MSRAPGREKLLARIGPQLMRNCLRADAAVAGRFSMCGLLLRLRNLYKWEHGLEPWLEGEPGAVLDWVSQREERWAENEGREPEAIAMDGQSFDPFDTDGINRVLEGHGLVYGAGFAGGAAPAFFLGELAGQGAEGGHRIISLGREYGRDILFLPGLKQNDSIYLRPEPLRYLLWDLVSDPRPRVKPFIDLGLSGYGLEPKAFRTRPGSREMDLLVAGELKAVLWHELGEAGRGAAAMDILVRTLKSHPGTELEHFVRGVKDLLADTDPKGRLGRIVSERSAGALGLYPVWLAGFPRLLFPEVDAAVHLFLKDGDWLVVEEARELGLARAGEALARLEELFDRDEGPGLLDEVRRRVIEPLTGHRSLPA